MGNKKGNFKFVFNEGDLIAFGCTYIKEAVELSNIRRHVYVKCICGFIFTAQPKKIISGHTKSCGCLRRNMTSDKNFRHGLRKLPEYTLWLNMKQRCTNPKYRGFKHWGGMGITICDRWLNSFENFYEDMGSQPFKRAGIDRIDNDKGYGKDNCRWASPKMQCNNTRRNIMIHYNNEIKSATMWAQDLCLSYSKMMYHIRKKEKSLDDIFRISKMVS